MILTATMRVFATSVIHQRRTLLIAVAAVSVSILLWIPLYSSPHLQHILPTLSDPHRKPITFTSYYRLLPHRYWQHRSTNPEGYAYDESCMKLPGEKDVVYAARSWQHLQVAEGNVYVYGAYYDDRFGEPVVRILMYTDVTPAPRLFCQLWFPDDNVPQTTAAEAQYGWLSHWEGYIHGVNEPYIMTCRYRRHEPDKEMAPVAAALVASPCGHATNVMDIQNAPFGDSDDTTKKVPSSSNGTSVAVCVKWLNFRNDVSVQIIEWMQLMKHFGAEKVYLYIIKLHHNARKVLKYYEDQGFAVVTELSHPPQLSQLHVDQNHQDYYDLRRELLPLNDCLYRSLGKHDWLAAIDLDELIVPTPRSTWQELIESKRADTSGIPFDAIIYPNYFVLDRAQMDLMGPAQTRLLSHTWRARHQNDFNHYIKSFVKVSSVTAMHNHAPIACHNECRDTFMSDGPGKLLHYRAKCSYDEEDCEALHDVVKEDNLARWRALVLAEIKEVLNKLGLEPLE